MHEEDEYKSAMCKKTSNTLNAAGPFVAIAGLLITVVSMFFGGWLQTLGLIALIFVGAIIMQVLHGQFAVKHKNMMTSLEWDLYEWDKQDTYGRVRNVISKKILTLLPFYTYLAVMLYLITGLELNIQQLGLIGVLLVVITMYYSVTIDSDLNEDHHASEVRVFFSEALCIILGLIAVAIGNFFMTIGYVEVLVGLVLIVTLATLYLSLRPLTPMDHR